MTMLMQRLRTLQLRLNSFDPGAIKEAKQRVLGWRAAAGDARAAERRRGEMHSYVMYSAKALNADFGNRLESEFLPRITVSFQTLIPKVRDRAEAASGMRAVEIEDDCHGRMKALERRSAAADVQLTDLCKVSEDAYKKFADVTERFDQIWNLESPSEAGGWRDAVQKVRAEKEASEKSPMEAFREDSFFDDDDADEPGSLRLNCPMCKAATGKRQPRTGVMEDIAGIVGIAPYRCSRCMVRFYRYRPTRKKKTA
jgi:hypothetical protein